MILDFAYSAFRMLYIVGRYGGFLLAVVAVIYMVVVALMGRGAYFDAGLVLGIFLLIWSGVVFLLKGAMLWMRPSASENCKPIPTYARRKWDDWLIFISPMVVMATGMALRILSDLVRRW